MDLHETAFHLFMLIFGASFTKWVYGATFTGEDQKFPLFPTLLPLNS